MNDKMKINIFLNEVSVQIIAKTRYNNRFKYFENKQLNGNKRYLRLPAGWGVVWDF